MKKTLAKEMTLAVLRHVLSAFGAALTTGGVLHAQEATAAVGAVTTLIGIAAAVIARRNEVNGQIAERIHDLNGK